MVYATDPSLILRSEGPIFVSLGTMPEEMVTDRHGDTTKKEPSAGDPGCRDDALIVMSTLKDRGRGMMARWATLASVRGDRPYWSVFVVRV
jgi:hypothetical protein